MARQDSKIAVEILQSVNNRTQSLRKILRMIITDIVIITFLGRVTQHPAGMHSPARCTDSGQTLQDRRALGSAWPCKISHQLAQGVGMRPPPKKKIPLFGKESPRRRVATQERLP